jgi:hypothetical protein
MRERKADPDKRLALVLLRGSKYWDQSGHRTVPDDVLERARRRGLPGSPCGSPSSAPVRKPGEGASMKRWGSGWRRTC